MHSNERSFKMNQNERESMDIPVHLSSGAGSCSQKMAATRHCTPRTISSIHCFDKYLNPKSMWCRDGNGRSREWESAYLIGCDKIRYGSGWIGIWSPRFDFVPDPWCNFKSFRVSSFQVLSKLARFIFKSKISSMARKPTQTDPESRAAPIPISSHPEQPQRPQTTSNRLQSISNPTTHDDIDAAGI